MDKGEIGTQSNKRIMFEKDKLYVMLNYFNVNIHFQKLSLPGELFYPGGDVVNHSFQRVIFT